MFVILMMFKVFYGDKTVLTELVTRNDTTIVVALRIPAITTTVHFIIFILITLF